MSTFVTWTLACVVLVTVAQRAGRSRLAVLSVGALVVAWIVGSLAVGLPWLDTAVRATLLLALYQCVSGYSRQERIMAATLDEARAALTAAQVREARLALAHAIHDGLGALLTAAVLNGEVARRALATDPDRATTAIDRALDRLHRAGTELRGLASGLRHEPVPHGLLVAEVRTAAEHLLQPAGVRWTLEVAGDGPPLPAQVASVVRLTLLETLTNTARHAAARTVRVELAFEADRTIASVEDDGVGIQGPPGFGLQGIRARAEALAGEVSWASRPSGGTRMVLRVPLAGAAS